MDPFYTNSLKPNELVLFRDYFVYDRSEKSIFLSRKKFFKATLIIREVDDDGNILANPLLTFYKDRKENDKWGAEVYIHRLYSQIVIKTLDQHSEFLRKGYQTVISKIYEEKTNQNGNPDCGPTGLICSFIACE